MQIIYIDKKKNKDGYHPIVYIYEKKLTLDEIFTIKEKDNIDSILLKYKLPLIDNNLGIRYFNLKNIDFMHNEITDIISDDFNFSELKTELKNDEHETQYKKFFKNIIIDYRKYLLTNSDWLFLNISDKTYKLSQNEFEHAKKLRKELKDIFEIYKLADLVKFNNDNNEWIISLNITEKYNQLINY